tara:strand:+ start:5335 stop:5802 length:468 start_codon:yes stop_codon:yes gene_type:complete
LADSLAMLLPNDIDDFVNKVRKHTPILLGFHNHDNNGIVFANIHKLIDKNIYMVDTTLSGFGKNGGNANLEQIFFYLALKQNYSHLNIKIFLELLDKLSEFDFGLSLDYEDIKKMLRVFMRVHSSHFQDVKELSLNQLYDYFLELHSKNQIKKSW